MLSFSRSDAQYIDELAGYVAIPSVSRDASEMTMRTAAQWLADQLLFADGRVESTAGHPVVRAEWMGRPGYPTVLVYGHYDVQPTGDLAEWRTPPFDLTLDTNDSTDVIRGRGSSDDKGPVYIVLKVAQAFMEQESGLPLNVKFLFEGEEEIGSPHLPSYLREHADELAADLVISADGAMWRPSEPSLSIASKGLLTLDVEVAGPDEDLHSGRFGGTVANPLHALIELLGTLHTGDGRVAVPRFYDGIDDLGTARRSAIAAVDFDEESYRSTLGVPQLFGETGYSTLERLWERPTLEINGITGGGKYTVIPHHATGHLSCRLVPGQQPEQVLEAITEHLLARPIIGVRVRVRPDAGGVPAYTIPADHPAIRAGRAALAAVYPDQEVLLAVIAGTLPATAQFEDVLGAKTLFFSFSTADEKLHAPNEFLRVARLREGMQAWEQLWRLLADGEHRLQPVTPIGAAQ
jgi:acetylornithine deacetylase/succinyl-diaminopimelate desuccinylase-like protein